MLEKFGFGEPTITEERGGYFKSLSPFVRLEEPDLMDYLPTFFISFVSKVIAEYCFT
jgi:hypothetical protein